MEYQEGIKVCSDCNAALVDELADEIEMVPLIQSEDKSIIEKLISYFDYSGLKAIAHYQDENELYVAFVPAKQQNQAKKLYQAFLIVESEKQALNTAKKASQGSLPEKMTELSEEDYEKDSDMNDDDDAMDDEMAEASLNESAQTSDSDSGVYVMKADRYKELRDTVVIFLLFGIVGSLVVLLNAVEVISLYSGDIPTIVLGALFLYFIYVGISTHTKAKQVQSEIDAENQLTGKINEWLKKHVTESFLESIHDLSLSDEINYIKKTDTIKTLLIKEFGEQNQAYLDRLIDEFYNNQF
jgi:hypothetical protein